MQYLMQVQTSTGGLPWQYEFDIANDMMAIEYTKRHTAQFASVPWFMVMVLWRKTEDGDHRIIAEFRVEEPTVSYKTH